MKKSIVAVLVGLVSFGALAATTSTCTNQLGQIVTKVVGDNGVTTTTVTFPTTEAVSPTVTEGAIGHVWLDTNTVFNATIYTPISQGDLALGIVSGKMSVAKGLTTNDWVGLN